jgi:hypothetical protein
LRNTGNLPPTASANYDVLLIDLWSTDQVEKGISLLAASRRFRMPFSYRTLVRRVEDGHCPVAYRIGKRYLVRPTEFQAWLRSQRA